MNKLSTLFLSLLFIGMTFLTNCGSEQPQTEEQQYTPKANSIELRNSWVRRGAQGLSTALYGELYNGFPAADTLLSVASKVAAVTELHESYTDDAGRMAMRRIPFVVLEPNTPFIMRPKSFHVMLINLHSILKEGDSVTVTFTFAKAGEIAFTAPVQSAK